MRPGFRGLNPLLSLIAVLGGVGIAYVDSRRTWDDTGITAMAMFALAGLVTLTSSLRPWLVALAVGVWIPAHAIVLSPHAGSFRMLAVLVFPFAGAYAGAMCRRLFLRTFENPH